ncbi:SRPBCC family protein [Engelhardtia mirabilis]|uniref:Polyketide cyclase / dehydrase and lipid transport n=1 Tax=Engelhardtia mirabilis TaxID=2528011 RepID=A0A518BII0_9BACT|nr:Polyketide cyclase / dehydrase and lipid transport [Planctomycetes bacterium Pla133]QDV01079.1 Polyketide cyclase / dehydrase and lipid transport [Planctomycetes bacterium Pla86]
MAGFSLEKSIPHPPAQVFAFATDLARIRTWLPDVLACEVVGGGPMRDGAVLRETRKIGRRECTAQISIVEHSGPSQGHEPPFVHAASSAAMGVRCCYRYTFADDGQGGTDLTMDCTGEPTNLLGRLLVGPLVRYMRRADGDQLERLSAALDAAPR